MSQSGDLYRLLSAFEGELAPSRDTPGAVRGFLLGDGARGILGHAEFEKVQPPGPSRAVAFAALYVAAGVVGTIAVVKTAPHVKRWLQEKALPLLKRKPAEAAAPAPFSTADFSRATDVVLEDCSTSMSSAEAQQRVAALLTAAAFIAEQVRMLSNARIEDDEAFPELQGAMRKLTTQQVTDSINRMLETNAFPLDEETSAAFMRVFGGGRVVDGQYVPLLNAKVKQALRLTDRMAV